MRIPQQGCAPPLRPSPQLQDHLNEASGIVIDDSNRIIFAGRANTDGTLGSYRFGLNKLNKFGGNFINAEMVKAFIVSSEYRQRFGS